MDFETALSKDQRSNMLDAIINNHAAIIGHWANVKTECTCDPSVGFQCEECSLKELMNHLNGIKNLYVPSIAIADLEDSQFETNRLLKQISDKTEEALAKWLNDNATKLETNEFVAYPIGLGGTRTYALIPKGKEVPLWAVGEYPHIKIKIQLETT